jgi:hypothetical protein
MLPRCPRWGLCTFLKSAKMSLVYEAIESSNTDLGKCGDLSSVLKIAARAQEIGLGGDVDLPERFYQAYERGCRSFSEWAFMSTSAKGDV